MLLWYFRYGVEPSALLVMTGKCVEFSVLHMILLQVVIRRLPPSFTKEQLEEQLHPLPAHDYFEFCTSDPR